VTDIEQGKTDFVQQLGVLITVVIAKSEATKQSQGHHSK